MLGTGFDDIPVTKKSVCPIQNVRRGALDFTKIGGGRQTKNILKMSDPLIWQCVKNHNAFLRKQGVNPKRGGMMCFSAEKGNLASLNSFKFSGIANSKQIHFSQVNSTVSGKDKKRIVMNLKVAKKANKPSKSIASTVVKSWSPQEAKKVIGSQVLEPQLFAPMPIKQIICLP